MVYEVCEIMESDFKEIMPVGSYLHLPDPMHKKAEQMAYLHDWQLPKSNDLWWSDLYLIGGHRENDTEQIKLYVFSVYYHEENDNSSIRFSMNIKTPSEDCGLIEIRIAEELAFFIYGESHKYLYRYFSQRN
jgi:hypothetical protein